MSDSNSQHHTFSPSLRICDTYLFQDPCTNKKLMRLKFLLWSSQQRMVPLPSKTEDDFDYYLFSSVIAKLFWISIFHPSMWKNLTRVPRSVHEAIWHTFRCIAFFLMSWKSRTGCSWLMIEFKSHASTSYIFKNVIFDRGSEILCSTYRNFRHRRFTFNMDHLHESVCFNMIYDTRALHHLNQTRASCHWGLWRMHKHSIHKSKRILSLHKSKLMCKRNARWIFRFVDSCPSLSTCREGLANFLRQSRSSWNFQFCHTSRCSWNCPIASCCHPCSFLVTLKFFFFLISASSSIITRSGRSPWCRNKMTM